MQSTLIDAGPLIALFDKNDRFHKVAKTFLREYSGRLITTWPVITETCHMLDFHAAAQIDFLKWLHREALQVVHLQHEHLRRLIELSEKYADVPMDLADASLVVIAEMLDVYDIITIDSDYAIYRTNKKRALTNLLAPYL